MFRQSRFGAPLPLPCSTTDLRFRQQTHLKGMITSVISLIRSNRANGIQTPSRSQMALLAAASEPPAAADIDGPQPTITVSNGKTTLPLDTLRAVELLSAADSSCPNAPLAVSDFGSLFDISPGLLVQSHLAAIERLYAIPPPSDSESSGSSDCESGDDREDTRMLDLDQQSTSNIKPKLAHSVSGSRSGRSGLGRPNSNANAGSTATTGREQYLIDPTAVAIPLGHPDVAHPRIGGLGLPSSSSTVNGESRPPISNSVAGRLTNGGGGGGSATPNASQTPQLSPKSLALRQQLFPELETDSNSQEAALQAPHSPSNNTSTDGGSESDEGGHHANHPVARGGRGAGAGATRGGTNGIARGRGTGRKLWEVVDSVRLLDGVL